MAKATAKNKAPKAKVKKVRTPEEKAARKEKRKAKRESRKVVNELKTRIGATSVAPVIAAFTAPTTSDGLPFSQSIDNPFSLRALMAVADEDAKIKVVSKAETDLANFRKKKFTPSVKEGILSFGE